MLLVRDLKEAALRHDDVRFDLFGPLEFGWIRRATGRDELRAALRHNFESLADQQPDIMSVNAVGDSVVLIGREPYRIQFVQRFLFRDGRLASIFVIAAHDTSVD